ncbi:hypothetical protein M7I_0994 [Glarea lozoyensis 74030]|uniref:Uncharacterized protein n=1 Tax=Glarea lozoyensis (strain ATCC 74030 / MF5533) TaxID=1104152 RepID=H0EEV9_GLAL7|nr:hypothetical protein M7I_0994 [Glarea lozoyensis 74030]
MRRFGRVVRGIIFDAKKAAFGVRHLAEVMVHEFAELARCLDAIVWSGFGAIASRGAG